MDNNNQVMYEVVIYRKDNGPKLIFTAEKLEEAKQVWQMLTKDWTESVKEQKPLVLESPEFTSFDPGLILEIKVNETTINMDARNKYAQQTVNKGFSETFQKNTNVGKSELMDNGYSDQRRN